MNHGVEYYICSDPGIFPYEGLRPLSLILSLSPLSPQSLGNEKEREEEDDAAAATAVALCQRENDAGNLKESTKDNSGGGEREDNEKAMGSGRRRRLREGDVVVGGGNEGINDNGGVADCGGIRPTKSPTMRRKIRHAGCLSFRCSLSDHIPQRQSCC